LRLRRHSPARGRHPQLIFARDERVPLSAPRSCGCRALDPNGTGERGPEKSGGAGCSPGRGRAELGTVRESRSPDLRGGDTKRISAGKPLDGTTTASPGHYARAGFRISVHGRGAEAPSTASPSSYLSTSGSKQSIAKTVEPRRTITRSRKGLICPERFRRPSFSCQKPSSLAPAALQKSAISRTGPTLSDMSF